ncbi:TonB-dependent receptor [Flavobacterium sp. DG1-102-2]|uniref:SusC/RagA family TonB-linked outer membrane protein n=1 Tax=Flavobacterium sp. DG1-102-2 TaxID=3081663 RepID=UPI002949F3B6|nr:TonB-dependent receptor [Flavobacterium sp. DG1-102-2]MDV6168138.1 TonB-dependent receptor [Flavobacterium sp. DG1-102-2]
MKNFILVLFLLLGSIVTYGQEITGTVVDSDGQPIPDAYISSSSGAVASSDLDGKFSIAGKAGDMITFSMIGFDKITVAATAGAMSVSMKTSAANNLEEVVVVGYGTQKRSNLTGAIGSVKADQFTKQPAFNAMGSIQGKVAGVQIINNDAPGAAPTVRIRGLGTAASGTEPLYVVDGIVTTDIKNISPADIESMDILKDASSAAIYGSNAANGVVLITTKKGKSGKMTLSASSSYAAKSILNQVDMASASQYVTYYNENLAAQGRTTGFLTANQPYNTDWFKEVAQVGHTVQNNVSVSGGSDNAQYFVSYNNYSEEGILKDQKLNRNVIRMNNTFKLFNDKLKITQSGSMAFTKNNPKPFGAFDDAYRQAPIVPTRYANGAYGQSFYNQTIGVVGYQGAAGDAIGRLNSIGNPLATVGFTNRETNSTALQGMFDAELKLTDWLKVNSRIGLNKSYAKTRTYDDIKGRYLAEDPTRTEADFLALQQANPTSTTYQNNMLSYQNDEFFRYNWDTFLTFDKQFDKHSVNVIAGVTRDRRNDNYTQTSTGYNVPVKEQYWNLNQASLTSATGYYDTAKQIISYFGRLSYNYDGKYFLTANFRRDGNSTFKNNEKYWGNFPSVSAGWVITRENFLSDIKGLDFLKIRGGYGELGNADVQFNQTVILRGTDSNNYNYVLGPGQVLAQGAYLGSPATPLSWEVTKEVNAGLDFELLDRRLTGSFDYYNRRTTNAILNVIPLRNSPNILNYNDHGAEIVNKGFEIGLNWKDNIGEDFTYFVGGTFTHNQNMVQNVKPAYDGSTGGSLANGQITKRLQNGQPIYSWWMYEADGVWQNQADIDANAHLATAQPGQLKYKDQNGDGKIDDADKKFFGNYMPKFNYGLTVGFNYKNFDFSVDGYGAGGNKIYNGLKGTRINGGENFSADMFNGRWTPDNTTATKPGANRDAIASSYYLEKADYLRINNITIGYTFNNVWKEIPRLRVYATAMNPFLITKYSGFTPELNTPDSNGNVTANGISGIELSAYPNVKTFIFGVSVDL